MDVFDWHSVEAQPMTGFPGVTIRWVIGPGVGAERFALRVFELQPGSEIPLHDHWYEQEMLVLAGQGTARTEHDEHAMGPGSALWVAPWERHSFAADGDEPLVFVCCVPLGRPSGDALRYCSFVITSGACCGGRLRGAAT